MKKETVERILGKVVGVELSAQELEMVAGGMPSPCNESGAFWTYGEYGRDCDFWDGN